MVIHERLPVTAVRIDPPQAIPSLGLRELWDYRELLYTLTWRDIKVRYKQAALGAAWAVIQPLVMMLVFSFFFGELIHVPSNGVPYPAFAYCGLVLWMYFSAALGRASNCLVENSPLLSKVYFPRLIVPAASVLFGLPDLGIAILLLLLLLVFFGIAPTAAVVFAVPFGLLAVITAFGASLWTSALNVRYRDVKYAVTVLLQVWLFLSPVVYSAELIPARWRALYGVNPMAGALEGFRWAMLGKGAPSWELLGASLASALLVTVSGLWFFRYVEQTFEDTI